MKYYLIHSLNMIEPKTIGPFKTREERDTAALDLHASEDFDQEDDVIFWGNVNSNQKLLTGSYSGAFFREE